MRRLGALAVALLIVFTVQTGAFGVTDLQRGGTLAVVDDDQAYLGVDQSATTTNGTTNLTVTVTNRLGESVDQTTVTVGGESRDLGSLGSGESGSVTFVAVDCTGDLTVAATGADARVRVVRAVECG